MSLIATVRLEDSLSHQYHQGCFKGYRQPQIVVSQVNTNFWPYSLRENISVYSIAIRGLIQSFCEWTDTFWSFKPLNRRCWLSHPAVIHLVSMDPLISGGVSELGGIPREIPRNSSSSREQSGLPGASLLLIWVLLHPCVLRHQLLKECQFHLFLGFRTGDSQQNWQSWFIPGIPGCIFRGNIIFMWT